MRFALSGIVPIVIYGCVYHERTAVPVTPPLSNQDVIAMTRSKVSDDVIISKITADGMDRTLSPDDIVALKREGVSDRVVQAMISAKPRPSTSQVTYHYYTPPAIYWGHWYGYPWHDGWYWYHGHNHHWYSHHGHW